MKLGAVSVVKLHVIRYLFVVVSFKMDRCVLISIVLVASYIAPTIEFDFPTPTPLEVPR